MTDTNLTRLAADLASDGRISADDVLAMRREIYGDTAISQTEAEALIALDEAADERCQEWDDLFVEALTDYVVHQQAPVDYIDDDKAAWIIAQLTHNGRIRTDSELELLVHMLEAATSSPPSLTTFALGQVKAAVVSGEGPLLRAGACEKGRISAGEVALLRRILYAAGGDANVAITRAEAEILFDINDACRGADNDPSWTDLFAKALAASVMTISGFQPVDRDTEERREAWLAQAEPGGIAGVAGFLGRMFADAPSGVAALGSKSGRRALFGDGLEDWRDHNAAVEADEAAAETVSQSEAEWLADRIGRDGQYDKAERALIDFLRKESPSIHPALKPLLDAA